MFSSIWQSYFGRSQATQRPPWRRQPRLLVLEDRMAPAVLTVNTLADNDPTTTLSLRQAINVVNAQSLDGLSSQQLQQISGNLGDQDTIQFADGTRGTITLTQGELDITWSVVLDGPGSDSLTIDAHGASRVLGILGSDSVVTLSGLTITNGFVSGASDNGAGIFNQGQLTIDATTLSNNINGRPMPYLFIGGGAIANDTGGWLVVLSSTLDSNQGYNGAGIFNLGEAIVCHTVISNGTDQGGIFGGFGSGISSMGTLTVYASTITNNSSAGVGGGLYNRGDATVDSTTVSGNTARNGGGGIDNEGTLTITSSTMSGNVARLAAGGVANGGTLTMTNCTLYGNNAGQRAAGFLNAGRATLTSVTVTGNYGGLMGVQNFGCGIDTWQQGTTLLQNTIVAGNYYYRFASQIPCDVDDETAGGGVDASSSYNLIGTGGSGGLMDGVNHNLVGVANPGLGPLGDYGGFTPTVQLLAGSPAIGNGDPSLLGTTDQRGIDRTDPVSIGAYQD